MSEYRYFIAVDEFGGNDTHHFRVDKYDRVGARVPGTDRWFSMADMFEGAEDLIDLYTPVNPDEKVCITELIKGAQI